MTKKECILLALIIVFLILFSCGWSWLEYKLFYPTIAVSTFIIGLIGSVVTIIMFFESIPKK